MVWCRPRSLRVSIADTLFDTPFAVKSVFPSRVSASPTAGV